MNYNEEYLDVQVALIEVVLLNMPEYLLDVSYSLSDRCINVQIVIVDGSELDLSIRKQIVENLKNFKVEIHVIHIPKSPFNANKGNWRPVEYSWLDNLVFSKAGYV